MFRNAENLMQSKWKDRKSELIHTSKGIRCHGIQRQFGGEAQTLGIWPVCRDSACRSRPIFRIPTNWSDVKRITVLRPDHFNMKVSYYTDGKTLRMLTGSKRQHSVTSYLAWRHSRTRVSRCRVLEINRGIIDTFVNKRKRTAIRCRAVLNTDQGEVT
jgi:hypothetical protein